MVVWIKLLEDAVERLGTKQAVAEVVGVSRSSISAALNGCYDGSTINLEKKVLATLSHGLACPHLQHEITSDECRSYRERHMPQSSAIALRHWRACQRCTLNPLVCEEREAV